MPENAKRDPPTEKALAAASAAEEAAKSAGSAEERAEQAAELARSIADTTGTETGESKDRQAESQDLDEDEAGSVETDEEVETVGEGGEVTGIHIGGTDTLSG